MSPKKKKIKISKEEPESLKRKSESIESSSKRLQLVKTREEDLQSKRRKNFVTACEQVSCKAYFDHRARLLLLYLPPCINSTACKHQDNKGVSIENVAFLCRKTYCFIKF